MIEHNPVENSNSISTADSAVEKSIVQRIVHEGKMLAIELPESVDDLKHWLIERENQLSREAARQGFGYLALKSQIKEGEFKNWLQANNLAERRVYELISVAKMLLNLPEQDKRKLLDAKKSQLIALARLPAENIAEISEAGQLDNLLCMPVKDLAQKLRNVETALDTEKMKTEELESRLQQRREEADFVVITRQESETLRQKASICIDDLSQLGADLVSMVNSGFYDAQPDNCHKVHIAASTLAIHLQAILAKASAALQHLQHHLPAEAIGPVNGDLLYTDEEIGHALREHADLVRIHEHEKHLREQQREMSKPRGRGRPKGSTKARD